MVFSLWQIVWSSLWIEKWVLPLEAFKSWAKVDLSLIRLTLATSVRVLTQFLCGLLEYSQQGAVVDSDGRPWRWGLEDTSYILKVEIKCLFHNFGNHLTGIVWWCKYDNPCLKYSKKKVTGMFQVWICPFVDYLQGGPYPKLVFLCHLAVSEILTQVCKPVCTNWALALLIALNWHNNETI